jgi:bacillithiol biosynthesis deacetylase BshB1
MPDKHQLRGMNTDQVDILCITAHPDDVEISMAGTVLRHVEQGRSVGLVELTAGELGTRGTPELRRREADAAMHVLGATFRYQLGLPDGFFRADPASLLAVVSAVRAHRPRLVLTNAVRDRHPDHGRAATLVAEACFLSGLRRITTVRDDREQEAWRPVHVLHAVQDHWIDPQVIVDITPWWGKKLEALACFRSQFHDPSSTEPESPISEAGFLPFLEGRHRQFGRLIGTTYAEGFTIARPPGVDDLCTLR